MFTNKNTLPIIGEYKSMGSRIFKFITPDDEMFLAYFTPKKGYIEVLFDSKTYPGFDKLTADGYTIEKINTISELMIDYEKKYGHHMKAFWWQATKQRFSFYETYFKENQSKLKTFKNYKSKWFEDQNYGYAALTKDPNFDFDESVIRFLM